MNFLILRDFFLDFCEFIFEFKMFRNNLKIKKGLFSHETQVDATWHARPCGRATQTHGSACVARM